MRPNSNRSSPVAVSSRITRASPASTTADTPSTVMEVSATFVASTIRLRGPARSARSCSAPGRSP